MAEPYKIHHGDCLEVLRGLPPESVQTCITSPPYWGLRDYGVEGQLGLEATPEEYTARIVEVFREVRRVLRDDGTLWLNLGDSYTSGGRGGGMGGEAGKKQRSNHGALLGPNKPPPGLKPKDLVGIPWRTAFALQADGWYLRSDIIWSKPNPMPESVTDRPTKAHEYIFLMTKNQRYYYDADAISESAVCHGSRRSTDNPTGETRNRRTVWQVTTQPYPEAHFATYPEALVLPCVLAGSPAGGTVLDPFAGSGTTGVVALKQGRQFVGIELNPEYAKLAERRIRESVGELSLMMMGDE